MLWSWLRHGLCESKPAASSSGHGPVQAFVGAICTILEKQQVNCLLNIRCCFTLLLCCCEDFWEIWQTGSLTMETQGREEVNAGLTMLLALASETSFAWLIRRYFTGQGTGKVSVQPFEAHLRHPPPIKRQECCRRKQRKNVRSREWGSCAKLSFGCGCDTPLCSSASSGCVCLYKIKSGNTAAWVEEGRMRSHS